MIKTIDDFLNKTTMYRVVLYGLLFLLAMAVFLSFFGLLKYQPLDLIMFAVFIAAVCIFTDLIFAWTFKAPSNMESVYITALILALIITPSDPFANLEFLAWASVLAMASKYIFAIGKKHIFNPAAFAVALTAIAISQSASWWIGNSYMAPFAVIAGFLIARKIKRFDLVAGFFIIWFLATSAFAFTGGKDLLAVLERGFLSSPLIFFAFVMLTEPMTAPPTRMLRVCYGALVGFLFVPQIHIGSFYFTPELALIAGNIFSYLVSPKYKLVLRLKEKTAISPDVYDFAFETYEKVSFSPGQYMEWTLEHPRQDSRGMRRFFTIASSPTEEDIRIGVKFYRDSSSFKKALFSLNTGDEIIASHLAGDFVLPRDKKQKLVFVAGGIGITPFRSMLKYLLDRGEARPIAIFYSNNVFSDILYKDILDESERRLNAKIIYTLTDAGNIPALWRGKKGYIDGKMIMDEVPDYKERLFYLSGPHSMVGALDDVLKNIGVKRTQIKNDYFPGFA